MERGVLLEYQRLRRIGFRSAETLRSARVIDEFEDLEVDGKVRLVVEPDPEPYDASYIDTWTDVHEHERELARREVKRWLEQDGCTMVRSEFLCPKTNRWISADVVGQFIGDGNRRVEECGGRRRARSAGQDLAITSLP